MEVDIIRHRTNKVEILRFFLGVDTFIYIWIGRKWERGGVTCSKGPPARTPAQVHCLCGTCSYPLDYLRALVYIFKNIIFF